MNDLQAKVEAEDVEVQPSTKLLWLVSVGIHALAIGLAQPSAEQRRALDREGVTRW